MAQLVVALDVPSAEDAERLIDQLYQLDVIVKIGLESLRLSRTYLLVLRGARREVLRRCEAARHPPDGWCCDAQIVRPGAHIVNVHALGGVEMMRSAVESAQERAEELGITVPHIFAVTILTSHGPRTWPSSACTAVRARIRPGSPRSHVTPAVRAWSAARTKLRISKVSSVRTSSRSRRVFGRRARRTAIKSA